MEKLILGLPELAIEKLLSVSPAVVLAASKEKTVCPHCGGVHLRKKDSFLRNIKNIPLGGPAASVIQIKCYKYKCLSCKKYFNTRLPSVKPWSRTTELLKRDVFRRFNRGVSGQDIAADMGIGVASVERYYHQMVKAKNSHLQNRQCPRILGIDEHRFTRKTGFLTTFCDLKKQRVFDVAQGKTCTELTGFLQSLQGREKVKVVCIDMCSAYRRLVREWFPNAQIVVDRFHVIRLVNQQFSKLCKLLDEPGTGYGRGGIMRILLTRPDRLSDKKKKRLDEYLKEQPALAAVYDFLHDLNDLLRLKRQTSLQCREHVANFLNKINKLKEICFHPLQSLGKTLYTWREEIARMFRFSKNNGITEGFHRKMKLIQRRAYGFRNFESYRLRVRILCG